VGDVGGDRLTPPAPRRARRRPSSPASRREARAGLLFASPWLFGLLALTLFPVVASVALSFTDWNLINSPRSVGFENYREMVDSRDFRNSVKVTLKYVVIGLPLFQIAGLGLALLLNMPLRGIHVFRTVLFLPAVLNGVAIAVLWQQLLRGNGPVNQGLETIGVSDPPNWLVSPDWAVPAVVLVGLWTTGTGAIIYLAGLQNIPAELYEAARVDGAGPFRSFLHITLPMLTPTLLFTLIIGVIGAFSIFDIAFVLGGSRGGSGGSLSFYLLYLWQEAFRNGRFGYGSALAWIFVAFAGAVVILLLRTARHWVYEEDGPAL
jgi:ABC-type sugar transport system permease subunit